MLPSVEILILENVKKNAKTGEFVKNVLFSLRRLCYQPSLHKGSALNAADSSVPSGIFNVIYLMRIATEN